MPDFADLASQFQANITPAMLEYLAAHLGVTGESLARIGTGWYPAEACWTFPERDAEGKVVGIVRRMRNDRKLTISGSKRGLTYPLAPEFKEGDSYVPGKENWVKVTADHPCPVCKHSDWCLVSADDPANPKAVICGRTPEGATRPLGEAGYLHILRPEGNVKTQAPLAVSTFPILVVEGQSDVAAGLDLGFLAVGKPSAAGGLALLTELLIGRDVAIIGENDAGPGREGMEKTFEALKGKASKLVKIMPPAGIKDLRAWCRQAKLSQADLLIALERGISESASTLLEDKSPLAIADRWLHEFHYDEDMPTLRKYRGEWFMYVNRRYKLVDEEPVIRGGLYAFLKDKQVKKFSSKGEPIIEPFEANRSKVSDIIDALNMACPVLQEPPCWLDRADHPDPHATVNFANGLLDVTGKAAIEPATPRFFTLAALPYDYNPEARCPIWLHFLNEVFPNDPEKIALLQEWFGYNMVADTSFEKLMIFVGRPGAGKGTVIEALRAMLGTGQVASTSFDGLTSDFGLQPLVGKLAAILPDAHLTQRGDSAKALEVIKSISGRDGVNVNRKYLSPLEDHRLTCRITIAVNELPDLPDHTRTLERRLLLIYFGQSFEGREDTSLKSRIAAEAPGIATWALDGLRRLRATGHFTLPASSKPVIGEFRRIISPISEFGEDCCTLDAKKCYSRQAVFDCWRGWTKDHGLQAGSRTRFGMRFLALHPVVTVGRRGSEAIYFGVTLNDDSVRRYLVK